MAQSRRRRLAESTEARTLICFRMVYKADFLIGFTKYRAFTCYQKRTF